MARYRLSEVEMTLWRYRLSRAVGKSFRDARQRLRRRVVNSAGNYEDVWNSEWWVASVDRNIEPVLRKMYEQIAQDAAIALGLLWLLRSDALQAQVEARLQGRLELIKGFGSTVDARVAAAVVEATGEAPGWLLDRLGLFDGSDNPGPLSPGLQQVIVTTESSTGANASATAAFDLMSDESLLEDASDEELQLFGDSGVKRWICHFVDSRQSHTEAHGQEVGPGEWFVVGGEFAEYPGDSSLSPAESVNCQCEVEVLLS